MSKYVETDMTMKNMLIIAKQALTIDTNRIEKKTVPGEPTMIGGVSYYSPDQEQLNLDLEYLISGNYPVPESESAEGADSEEGSQDGATGTASAVQTANASKSVKSEPVKDTSTYKIHVLNGNGISGTARRASDLLKIEDIAVSATGNASDFNIENTVIYYKDDIAFANKIKGILETGKVQKGTKDVVSSEPDIVVVLGKDFN